MQKEKYVRKDKNKSDSSKKGYNKKRPGSGKKWEDNEGGDSSKKEGRVVEKQKREPGKMETDG